MLMNRCGLISATLLCSFIWSTTLLVCDAAETTLTARSSAELREILSRWLECTECNHGELEAVVRLKILALPGLMASFREGPSPANREAMRVHLMRSYKHLAEYKARHQSFNLAITETEYLDRYLENYIAQYRIRAAIALGRIGGLEAKRALEDVQLAPLREDVRNVVRQSLEQISKPGS